MAAAICMVSNGNCINCEHPVNKHPRRPTSKYRFTITDYLPYVSSNHYIRKKLFTAASGAGEGAKCEG